METSDNARRTERRGGVDMMAGGEMRVVEVLEQRDGLGQWGRAEVMMIGDLTVWR